MNRPLRYWGTRQDEHARPSVSGALLLSLGALFLTWLAVALVGWEADYPVGGVLWSAIFVALAV
jgi:hypothetical protein